MDLQRLREGTYSFALGESGNCSLYLRYLVSRSGDKRNDKYSQCGKGLQSVCDTSRRAVVVRILTDVFSKKRWPSITTDRPITIF
jgi:hypothetical protein